MIKAPHGVPLLFFENFKTSLIWHVFDYYIFVNNSLEVYDFVTQKIKNDRYISIYIYIYIRYLEL